MPQVPHFNNPAHWRDRAEEARILAEQMNDEVARATMRRIAEDYDLLASRAVKRITEPEKA